MIKKLALALALALALMLGISGPVHAQKAYTYCETVSNGYNKVRVCAEVWYTQITLSKIHLDRVRLEKTYGSGVDKIKYRIYLRNKKQTPTWDSGILVDNTPGGPKNVWPLSSEAKASAPASVRTGFAVYYKRGDVEGDYIVTHNLGDNIDGS